MPRTAPTATGRCSRGLFGCGQRERQACDASRFGPWSSPTSRPPSWPWFSTSSGQPTSPPRRTRSRSYSKPGPPRSTWPGSVASGAGACAAWPRSWNSIPSSVRRCVRDGSGPPWPSPSAGSARVLSRSWPTCWSGRVSSHRRTYGGWGRPAANPSTASWRRFPGDPGGGRPHQPRAPPSPRTRPAAPAVRQRSCYARWRRRGSPARSRRGWPRWWRSYAEWPGDLALRARPRQSPCPPGIRGAWRRGRTTEVDAAGPASSAGIQAALSRGGRHSLHRLHVRRHAHREATPLAHRQHLLESPLHDRPKLLVDLVLGPEERLQVLHPLEVADGHPAGVGQDVRDQEDPAVAQDLVGLRSGRPGGALHDQPGPHLTRVAGGDLVAKGGRDQQVAIDRERAVGRDLLASREALEAPLPPAVLDQPPHREPPGVADPSVLVGDRDHREAHLLQQARRDATDVAKALHRHLDRMGPHAQVLHRRQGADRHPPTGGLHSS